jgi:SH3 domain protein
MKLIIGIMGIIWLVLCANPLWAQDEEEVQEIKYVTDVLRLSLYKKSSDSSGTVKLLSSGDRLQILQQKGPYSRVRIDNGSVGWVKTGFLVSEPTATNKLRDEQQKNEILAAQLEKYSNTQKVIDDYENTIKLMTQDQTAVEAERDQLKAEQESLQLKHAAVLQELEKSQSEKLPIGELLRHGLHYWYVILGLVVLLLFIGYQTGKQVIARRVRKRFQGVKVW